MIHRRAARYGGRARFQDAGVLAVLTLTGEANAEEAARLPAEQRPDLIIRDLGDLIRQLVAARGSNA